MLIALTITPTILKLIVHAKTVEMSLFNLGFALCLFIAMIAADKLLPGIWKSTMIVWAIIAGSISHLLIVPPDVWLKSGELGFVSPFFSEFTVSPVWDPGLLISFLVCFIALSINDLGSIQSIGRMINPPGMERRVTAGINRERAFQYFCRVLRRDRVCEFFHERRNNCRQW